MFFSLGGNCTNGLEYSDCANECDTSCESLTCDYQCKEPANCVPGCVCPVGKVIGSNGQCVDPKDCPCRVPTDNTTLVNGESNIRDPCKTYTCLNGCLTTTNNNCSVCEWSQWTQFPDCSDTCNGTRSRFRSYNGTNCQNSSTEEDKQPCSSNCTIVCSEIMPNGTEVNYPVGAVISETRCSRT